MTVSGSAVVVRKQDRIFFCSFAVAAAISVFIGFAPTFYLKPYFSTRPLTPLLIVHGLVFSTWIVLFAVQTLLVATHRTPIHRRLGWFGAALALTMLIVGTLTGIMRAKAGEPPPGIPVLAFLTIPLGDMFVFGCLTGAAVYCRQRLDAHKRLMMLATLAVLPAAFARWPFAFTQQGGVFVAFGLADLGVVLLLVYDVATRGRGRPHTASVLGGLLLIVSHPLRMVVGVTHPWLSFATWLTSWTS